MDVGTCGKAVRFGRVAWHHSKHGLMTFIVFIYGKEIKLLKCLFTKTQLRNLTLKQLADSFRETLFEVKDRRRARASNDHQLWSHVLPNLMRGDEGIVKAEAKTDREIVSSEVERLRRYAFTSLFNNRICLPEVVNQVRERGPEYKSGRDQGDDCPLQSVELWLLVYPYRNRCTVTIPLLNVVHLLFGFQLLYCFTRQFLGYA